ncbi:MAG: hypothetical protein WAN03_10630 [Candidatus Sulfotelmatobacter sp.]
MTTDGKLEKLTERVDGLAHSVELPAGMQIESEKRMSTLIEQSTDLKEKMATLADIMAQLKRIVLNHSERLDDLEGDRAE